MKQNDLYDSLAALADQGRWEDAYIWFREHQDQFSRREQRLIRAALSRKLWRAPVLLAVVTLVFQVTAGGLFENQLQDIFSFLGWSFRPYMYAASVVPLIVTLGLAVLLAVQCYERLFGRRPLWGGLGADPAAGGLVGVVIDTLCPGPAHGDSGGVAHRHCH